MTPASLGRFTRNGLALLGLALVLGACSSAASTPSPAPTSAADAAYESCAQEVRIANRDAHNVKALDFAIHDCPSLAVLKRAIAANPGYLNASTSPEEFVANRCADPGAEFAGLATPICDDPAVKAVYGQ